VSLSGEVALLGAVWDDDRGEQAGAAYVFSRSGADWSEQVKLTASDGAAFDHFGIAVSQSGRSSLVGAQGDDDYGAWAGAAYAFAWGRTDGDGCAEPAECLSGHCVDGVCCDGPCDETCEACSAALKGGGEDGVCDAVVADSDPDDDCPADPDYPSSCGADGLCDGQGQCRLFAAALVECVPWSCSNGEATLASRCDGSGHCVDWGTESCEPFACGEGACETSCSSDADCLQPFRCDVQSGSCVAVPECHDYLVIVPNGAPTACSPYRCTDDGQCIHRCQSTTDCVDGYRCASNGDCVPAGAMGADEADSGCACAQVPPPAGRTWTLLLAGLALCGAGWQRRARRARQPG